MRKHNTFAIKVLCIVSIVAALTVGSFSASDNKYYDQMIKYKDQLNTQKWMQLDEWTGFMQFGMYQEYYDTWICSGALGDGTVIEILLNEGYYREYIDEMKSLGVLRADYELPSGTSTKTTTSAATATAMPEPITTTKCDEKTMWAKSQVNVRENGSTSYKKVGSLKKDEQVTVTGIDSTGWYEIRLADGTVGHVSDKYLTEVDPSVNTVSTETEGETPQETPSETVSPKKESRIISIDGRTVVWYNAETDQEEEVTFNDATPLDEVEEMANTYLIHGAELVESTPEPTEEPEESPEPVETIAPTVKPEATPTVEPSAEPEEQESAFIQFVKGPIFIFGSLAIGIIAVITGIVMMIRIKKRR